ncbi:hypothetical protein Tco_1229639 [Tanacetum coccineum]
MEAQGQCLEIVPDDGDDVTIDATPLSIKAPTIGRIVGIKRLLNVLEVTAAKVCVTAAKLNTASIKLVLLVKIEENILSSYYCLYTVNAAGYKVNVAEGVNAASEEVSTAELVSTAYEIFNWDQQVVEVSSDEEDFSDEGLFGDEDLVLFNDVKYSLADAEIMMFKERPTTSSSPIASTSTTSRSIVPIASTSNAQAASTAPIGYKKIAMTGCVLGLRAPNDPNAPPPSTTRKRKP